MDIILIALYLACELTANVTARRPLAPPRSSRADTTAPSRLAGPALPAV